jgi:hercynylcysteine S-oxide lyase
MSTLAERWRAARPAVAGIHVDSAACSRQSHAMIEAAAAHARHEAEVGGYVAADAAAPVLAAGRAAVAVLTGFAADDVLFTTGASDALDIVLGEWSGARTVACLPGEYGPNLAALARSGFTVEPLPVDGSGRLDVAATEAYLAANPVGLLHITVIGSHRGTVQPAAAAAEAGRAAGVPVIADAAQAFAQVDCAGIGADVLYTSSRKWTAGPRGVGLLATRPGWFSEATLARLAHREANAAAHVALSVALGEYLAADPQALQSTLIEVGSRTRTVLSDLDGWRVVEAVDEPSAITTVEPPEGVDPVVVRARLIAEHAVVTTCAGVERAPGEMTRPALRISPHVDVTDDDLTAVVAAIAASS